MLDIKKKPAEEKLRQDPIRHRKNTKKCVKKSIDHIELSNNLYKNVSTFKLIR